MKKIITIILTCIMMLSAFNIYALDKDCIFETGADGKQYWYENNQIQGTLKDPKCVMGDGSCRGREIYDPASNGWYWLDSVYDGAKAEGKEVWIPYIYQQEKDWNDSIKLEQSKASDFGMQSQIYEAMINKSGKWVRYDANGKMAKGWYAVLGEEVYKYPDQVGNIYYYDTKTGMMAKGIVNIDGKDYHFDTITGVCTNYGNSGNTDERLIHVIEERGYDGPGGWGIEYGEHQHQWEVWGGGLETLREPKWENIQTSTQKKTKTVHHNEEGHWEDIYETKTVTYPDGSTYSWEEVVETKWIVDKPAWDEIVEYDEPVYETKYIPGLLRHTVIQKCHCGETKTDINEFEQ